jgi:alpha/beta superfamily hydrolase
MDSSKQPPHTDPASEGNAQVQISPSGRFDLPVAHGRLEALLKETPDAVRAAVVCHPHPKGGGTMNNNVVYRVAKALEERGSTVLRFNFRGVGRSTGVHDDGIGEGDDVRAAVDFLAARYPGLPLWLAGFSFGSRVGLAFAMNDPRITHLLGVGLAVRMFDLSFMTGPHHGKPLAVVQADNDEYGDRPEIEAFFSQLPDPKRLWIVENATHLFPGRLDGLEEAAGAAVDWLASQ